MSIGYKSIQADQNVVFDAKKGIVPNINGRVLPGVYTAGWLATGPRGVIIDTMNNAFKVAANVVEDLKDVKDGGPGRSGMGELGQATSWQDWKAIERVEEETGKPRGKLREKLWTVESMLAALKCWMRLFNLLEYYKYIDKPGMLAFNGVGTIEVFYFVMAISPIH